MSQKIIAPEGRKIIVMGVTSTGKSEIGSALANALGATFVDGDDLHPASNRAKMAAGTPLDDSDRAPWLATVGDTLARTDGATVVACSALKRSYRDAIALAAGAPVTFLHLSGPRDLIAKRMAARTGHFMPTSLLDSQFATLEPPGPDERAIAVDIDTTPQAIVAAAIKALENL